MKVKVTIPEDISDITLGQYQEYEALNDKLNDKEIDVKEYNKQKISLFAGIPYNRMNQVSYKDFAELLKDIDKALDQECKFVNRFTIDNIEFGFINMYSGSTSTLSSCCRLRSDKSSEYFNSFGSGSTKIGSLGVCTINMPRLAFKHTGNDDAFIDNLIELAIDCQHVNSIS